MKPSKRVASLVPLAASVLLLAGCATPSDDGAFDVSLVNLGSAPGGGGIGEAALSFTIRLQNGSPVPLAVTGASHRIYLNDVYVGQGLSNQALEVPRLGTATQEVTVHLSTFRLAKSFQRIFESRTVSYRLESTVYTGQTGWSRRLKAAKSGTVDFEALGNSGGATAPSGRIP